MTRAILEVVIIAAGALLCAVSAYFGAYTAMIDITLDDEGGENDVEDSGQSG